MGTDLRVLIVEDSESDALLVIWHLRKHGYEPVYERVESSAEMNASLDRQTWDIIISDYVLPQFGGLDALRLLQEKKLDIPCIITSGQIDEETAVAAMRAGARDYVMKNNLKRLGPAVARELSEAKIRQERRQAEEIIRQNEAKLGLVLEQMPCILWTTDTNLVVTSLLGAGLRDFNFKSGQAAVLTVSDIMHCSDPNLIPILSHNMALAGKSIFFELELQGKMLYCFLEPLRLISGEIVGVIGTALDVSDKKRAEEELRALSQRLVTAQETERRSIARELHDEIGQTLTVLKLMLSQAARSLPEQAGPLLHEAQSVLTGLIQQVRELSLNLRPSMLDDLGLLPTLTWHVEHFCAQTRIKVNFEHDGLQKSFSPEISITVYRIIQEALTNAARYSEANEVNVRIQADGETISMEIADRGCGFDLASLSAKSSTGLSGMRERANLLGGKFTVETAPCAGTRINVILPV